MTQDNKTAVVTGAARGLGLALVAEFASRGWRTVSVVRTEEDASRLKSGFSDCHTVVSDLSVDGVKSDIYQVLESCTQRVDVLVNNAGNDGKTELLKSLSTAELQSLLDVHLLGALRATQAAMELLRPGSVVANITSRFGSIARTHEGEFRDMACPVAYSIAKAAQNMLTVCLSQELESRGVEVVGIHPGALRTRLGMPDAQYTADQAASSIVDLLVSDGTDRSGKCFSPWTGVIPW